MKMISFIAATLLSVSALAANDSIKICNLENKFQSFEIAVKGKVLTTTVYENGRTETESDEVDKILKLTRKDLNKIASENNLNVTLVSGTAYSMGEGAWAIVSDSTGVKYLVMILGPMLKITGDSKSCE